MSDEATSIAENELIDRHRHPKRLDLLKFYGLYWKKSEHDWNDGKLLVNSATFAPRSAVEDH